MAASSNPPESRKAQSPSETDGASRLARRVCALSGCSRREAEQYIEGGWVTVDGVVTEEPGARVHPLQMVVLLPEATLAPVEAVTILVHKPAGIDALGDLAPLLGLLTPAARAADDRSGQRILRKHHSNLILATPLPRIAGGLVVLTQDYRVARKLVEEAARIEHEYVVEVAGAMVENGLALLNAGLPMPGRPPGAVKVSWQNETRLRFAAKALKTGHITLMCTAVGLQATSMRRIRVGRIAMAGLPAGQWRYLAGYERF